jgi:hypothetical protein
MSALFFAGEKSFAAKNLLISGNYLLFMFTDIGTIPFNETRT